MGYEQKKKGKKKGGEKKKSTRIKVNGYFIRKFIRSDS